MTKIADLSVGFSGHGTNFYTCAFDWPDDCYCQAGTDGIVFSKDGGYNTAFFEAFPHKPDTFIRGEGVSVELAEQSAWTQYQRNISCPSHEFERRGYTNGGGICKHCGLWNSKAFEPSTRCCICDVPTDFTLDSDKKWYCEDHQREKPLEKWTYIDWHIAYSENAMARFWIEGEQL